MESNVMGQRRLQRDQNSSEYQNDLLAAFIRSGDLQSTLPTLVLNVSQHVPSECGAKARRVLSELKHGKREGSMISVQTVDSPKKDEHALWQTIRKDLENVRVSLAA